MPLKPKKPIITWIRDITAILALVGILWKTIGYFNQKAIDDALLRSKMETILENQQNAFEKFKELDLINIQRAELDGKIIEHIRTDTN